MASRFRPISRPATNLLKSTITNASTRPVFPVRSIRSSPPIFSRPMRQMGALESLLPLHTPVSSARLTSCLGSDPNGCRLLSQVLFCNTDPGG